MAVLRSWRHLVPVEISAVQVTKTIVLVGRESLHVLAKSRRVERPYDGMNGNIMNAFVKRVFSTTACRPARLPIVLPGERVHTRGLPPDPTVDRPPAISSSLRSTALALPVPAEQMNAISFRDLPPSIFRYIRRQLRLRDELLEKDPHNPNLRHSNVPLITPIDNPFLMHAIHISVQSPLPGAPPKLKWKREFSTRRQADMIKSWGRLILPPSPKNFLENPPLVEWLDGRYIEWYGKVEKQERKGLYANRPVMFKGHFRERVRQARRQEIQARLDTMDNRIAKWKAAKATAVKTGRAAVPF